LKNADRDYSQKGRPGRGVFWFAAALAVAAAFATPANAEDAKTLATTVCVACHGDDGNSAIPMFPKIAGLQETYIIKQLKEFISGQRKSDVMAPIVANLKPEDLAPLATHFSSQKPKAGDARDAALVETGKNFYLDGNEDTGVPACVGCHQPQAVGHTVYPRLAGQHPEYLVQQLKNFASGDRSNDVSRYMRVIAKRMTEQEMKAVAEYIASLGAK
jgi:cytochrome c553